MIPNEYRYHYECSASAVDAVRQGRGRAEYLLKQQQAFYAEAYATPRQAASAGRAAWRERERTYMAEAAPKENAAEPNDPAPTEGYASDIAGPNHAEPT